MNYQVCTHWNVLDLLRMQRKEQLKPPPEFQRGPKWSGTQKKLYIDSLLRGYPSPAFYFHCDQPDAIIRHDTRLRLGVVDGQQRLDAMREFGSGEWSLLKSPEATPGGSKHFPVETARDREPEWCGLRYEDFSDDLKKQFVYLTLPVIVVKTTELEIVRDLFIRLQAGTALSAQERRDAWPGELPEYIKRVGGHPHGKTGLRIFSVYTRGKDDTHRRAAAQAFLVWSHWTASEGDFPDISSERLDDLYRQKTDFEGDSVEAQRFKRLLMALGRALRPKKGKWPEWIVLHMAVLLEEFDRRNVVKLTDVFTPKSGAGQKLYLKLLEFTDEVDKARAGAKTGTWASEASRRNYDGFAQYIQHDANASNSLRTRHEFLREWLWERLEGVKPPEDALPSPQWAVQGTGGDELDLDFLAEVPDQPVVRP